MSHSSRPALMNNYETQSDVNFAPSSSPMRALSPDDIHKLKYKIDLGESHLTAERTNERAGAISDKQVAEKQQRLTREWEKKIEHDKKYVNTTGFCLLCFSFHCCQHTHTFP
jgi:hypothetical protein